MSEETFNPVGDGGAVPYPGNTASTPQQTGATLEAYAAAKRLPEQFLRSAGLSDCYYLAAPAIRIPYRAKEGTETAVRFRLALSGEGKFRWRKGDKPRLYGLERLAAVTGDSITLVEGESDCHTLWNNGIAAVGLPGANGWREDRDAPELAAFSTIYVVIEPDDGGKAMLDWLRRSSIKDRVRLVRLPHHKDPSDLWLADPVAFTARWQQALDASVPWHAEHGEDYKPEDEHASGQREPGDTPWISAAALQAKEFPPVAWVVPNILPQGVTILAGRPKLGKSWLGLDCALAVASGGKTLGIQCQQGDVLYAALEDTERRLQARMQKMDVTGPERLHFLPTMPKADEGGIDLVRSWLEQAARPRLVIIDVLTRVRSGKATEEGNYAADYNAVAAWKALADEFGIAIVLVHHVRKMGADDKLEMISGTNGLTGAADTLLILNRDSQGCTLGGRGRDLEEFELAVQFDPSTCRWKSLGTASEARRSDERTEILRCLMDAGPEGLSPKELADEMNVPGTNIRQLLRNMAKAGEILKAKRGRYLHPAYTTR